MHCSPGGRLQQWWCSACLPLVIWVCGARTAIERQYLDRHCIKRLPVKDGRQQGRKKGVICCWTADGG